MTVIAVLNFFYGFRPKLEVMAASPWFERRDPFQTPFVVRNGGVLSINKVEASCLALDVRTDRYCRFSGLDIGDVKIESVPSGSSATVPCPFRQSFTFADPQTGFSYADVMLIVRYDYGFWGGHHVCAVRFVANRDQSGVLHWLPQPAPEIDLTRIPRLPGAA